MPFLEACVKFEKTFGKLLEQEIWVSQMKTASFGHCLICSVWVMCEQDIGRRLETFLARPFSGLCVPPPFSHPPI